MLAKNLYKRLELDFIKPEITENWIKYMTEIEPFLCENFKARSIGLVCDFTKVINKVFTAVFPSEKVLQKVLDSAGKALLFLHHPSIWDLKKGGFYQMDKNLLEKLKQKQISVYNLHFPLDNFSEYSTSKTLADRLGIEIIKPFAYSNGAFCGIIGKTKYNTLLELQNEYSKLVGHDIKLYKYGNDKLVDNNVAIVAGGGNDIRTAQEMIDNGINTLITGISLVSPKTINAHEFAKNNCINILGGTHYSSEKFACISICEYFKKLDLPSEFIADEPCYEDM